MENGNVLDVKIAGLKETCMAFEARIVKRLDKLEVEVKEITRVQTAFQGQISVLRYIVMLGVGAITTLTVRQFY